MERNAGKLGGRVNLMEMREMKGRMGGKVRMRRALQARQGT